ncbi:hypothetical protein LTR85_010045 [Meristemomyces frigidus]|nr:hypothetical protein LTR85_010045 [Meristemomyces frigidus]
MVPWYGKHFGFRRIKADNDVDGDKNPQAIAHMSKLYGNKLRKVKVVFLTTGNSVGFELFEFIDPPVKPADMETWTLEEQYQRGGVFHFCLTVPEPQAVCDAVCKDGAAQIGEMIHGYDGEGGLYLRDPWGNVIELLSCSYEQLLANRTGKP